VVAVRMVQVPVHEVIDVVAVRDGLVAAAGAVLVIGVVPAAFVFRRALVGILAADVNHVLVDVVLVRMVQVPVMQVIDVAVMNDRGMPAARAVNVVMIRVLFADAGVLKAGHAGSFISRICVPYTRMDHLQRMNHARKSEIANYHARFRFGEKESLKMRVYNFSAGPAMLPVEVLEASAKALVDYQGKGFGIAECSHRGKEFDGVLDETISRARSLMGIPDNYDVVFTQGGASQLFITIPWNFMQGSADFVVTGEWAKKAAEAAKPYGTVNVLGSSESTGFDHIPTGWKPSAGASYLHICTNNTIYGTRFSQMPEHPTLIADMSSEYMSRVVDVKKFAMIYGGAQKNLGPSGVCLCIVRKDLYSRIPKSVPKLFNFQAIAEAKSCINTPPTFGIYMLLETFRWIEKQGGIAAIEKRNEEKAKLIYDAIDRSEGYYVGTVKDVPNRSRMNITYRLPSEELTDKFVKQAEKQGMVALKGYRTVGGIRASTYNAMPVEGCAALAKFMDEFRAANRK